MDNFKIFKNNEFGSIRTIEANGETYFVGKDIAVALGYARPANAVADHVSEEDKTSSLIQVSGSNYKSKTNLINESGLYSLILSSKLPTAKKFKRWVTSEVLPAIRKTGKYEDAPQGAELLALGLLEAKKMLDAKDNTIKVQQQVISELKPKADYTDIILKSKSLVKITSIAKDYGMSGKALNKLLHELKIQYKLGTQWLLYSKYQACGYTHSETIEFKRSNGLTDVNLITKWTQKGRLFLYNKLKENGVIPIIERQDD